MHDPINVLFLGNSLIYFHDMPKLFENLARSAGKAVTVDSVTRGSATMSDFAAETTSVGQAFREKLAQPWDYIIIEPSRRITPADPSVLEAELASAKILHRMAGQAGAQTLLYAVWGNNTGWMKVFHADSPTQIPAVGRQEITRSAHAAFMRRVSEQVSVAIGDAPIIDAGRAFEAMLTAHPDVDLYDPDQRHPSLEGSYLAACTVYTTLFGEPTAGIAYTADLAAAPLLQNAADAVMPDR